MFQNMRRKYMFSRLRLLFIAQTNSDKQTEIDFQMNTN
jgi:hypothetical protein